MACSRKPKDSTSVARRKYIIMSPNLQKIQEAVYASCPELLELSFGCQFSDKNLGKRGMIVGERIHFGSEGDYNFEVFVWSKEVNELHWMQADLRKPTKEYDKDLKEVGELKIEILGHPIQLQHVLRTIPHLMPRDGRNIVPGQAESFGNKGWIGTLAQWDLTRDLSNQSEETLAFIASLLG